MKAQLLAFDPPDSFDREGDRSLSLARQPAQLDALSKLSSVEIEASLSSNLSNDLHVLFDPVSEGVLPIYFGPLLGRLYLEGL